MGGEQIAVHLLKITRNCAIICKVVSDVMSDFF